MIAQDKDRNTLYLIYDDECPLCRSSAHALNIKKAVGNLVLINARESHTLVNSAYERGFDPDQGIVVIYNDQYYFGADAVHFLALLNSSNGILNRVTAILFRSRSLATIFYPVVKSIRRLLLNFKGVGSVKRNEGLPLFAQVLGKDWQTLSPVMKKRFSNRPYSNDMVLMNGTMTIKSSRWMRFIKPALKLTGALIQQDGENIPVVVKFRSEPNTSKYWFDREFCFNQPVRFKSYMRNIKNNIMVEFMRFNIGWRAKFSVSGGRVVMSHCGYVFRFFNFLIPLPISLFLGECNAVEGPMSDDTFSMEMSLNHFLFGEIYQYKGIFKIAEVVSE
jgi:predicted DCC family thiol-disulfide oxidoreductase YuxK